MKSRVENITKRAGFSWRYKQFDQPHSTGWHYHLEYELLLCRQGEGYYFVAEDMHPIKQNTLYLLSPKTSHQLHCTTDNDGFLDIHNLWFSHQWIMGLVDNCVEFEALIPLFEQAQRGITFSEEVAKRVFTLIDGLPKDRSPLAQLNRLFQVLNELVVTPDKTSLHARGIETVEDSISNLRKVEKACEFIEKNYMYPITLEQLANYVCTSQTSIHRLFEHHFKENFSTHLKKYRLGQAGHLLINSDMSIALIAEKVGYTNQSNFNRQFKQYRHRTPREFRKYFTQHA